MGNPQLVLDGWYNLLTELGVQGKDKRTGANFATSHLATGELEEQYRGNDLAARIIDQLPEDGLRQGWQLAIEGDKELSDVVMTQVDEMEWNDTIQQAVSWQRCYGGAATLLGVRDGLRLNQPLELEGVESFEWLTNFHAGELRVEEWYDDVREANFGKPKLFKLLGSALRANGEARPIVRPDVFIHESRLLIWDGIRTSRTRRNGDADNNGWGDSVLVRCNDVLRDFGLAWASAAALLQDFSQAVYKIEGLAESLAGGQEDRIKARVRIMEYARSVVRAVLLDSQEDFERKTTNIAGLPEMLDRFQVRLASAARMPVTVLMGISPAGLNATGESDTRHWYDTVRSWQEKRLKPQLNRLLSVAFAARNWPAGGEEPDIWSVKFKPLWQASDAEKADIRSKMASADKALVDAGILLAEEIAESRYGGDEYSLETTLNDELREAFAKEEAAAEETAQELAMAQAENPQAPNGGVTNVAPANAAAKQANGQRAETR